MSDDGREWVLNLIDTPGHVDFSYEVSRALQACEGAVLVVDASQGIEAQTLANAYLAVAENLTLIPVVNKIDLPAADPMRAAEEIEEVLGLDASSVLPVSAKEGTGIHELLERIVREVPPPQGDPAAPLRALIFDAWFDSYVGVAALVRVVDGSLARRQRIKFMAQGSEHEVDDLQVVDPHPRRVETLSAGEVGIVIPGIKSLDEVRIGDTVTLARGGADAAAAGLPGSEADGLQRALPGGPRRLRGPEGGPREAAPQRLLVPLRAGVERGPRLRLPLRIPRLPARGDHPGAPGARVRPQPDHHGARPCATRWCW